MQNAGLSESQAEIKIAGRNINNLRYADDTTLMAESEEKLKSLLMTVKGESEKAGLKVSIKKLRSWASSPITSREKEGEKVEAVRDFIFLGSKVTVDSDLSHKIKRHLFLERKAMTNFDSVLKNRDIFFPAKIHIVKVMYRCENWMIRLNAKELMLLNCGAGENSLEPLELQGDQTSQS